MKEAFRKQQTVLPFCVFCLGQMLSCCSALHHAGDTAAVTNIIFLCFGNAFKDTDEAESRMNRVMQ